MEVIATAGRTGIGSRQGCHDMDVIISVPHRDPSHPRLVALTR
jgi:hypothetical protein